MQGTNTINAITIGSSIVQENDINWSKRILGKEALTHIKTKTIIQDFIPIVKPYIIPSIKGYEVNINTNSAISVEYGLIINTLSKIEKRYNT